MAAPMTKNEQDSLSLPLRRKRPSRAMSHTVASAPQSANGLVVSTMRKQERAIDHQQNDEHDDECDGKEKPVNSSEGFNQVSR